MRICRAQYQGEIFYGLIEGDDGLRKLAGGPFEIRRAGSVVPLEKARLLAPCEPSKVVCVGLNYATHAREMGLELPANPILFIKPPTSVIGPEDEIVYTPMSKRVDYEAELAVVIGKTCSHVEPEKAMDYVLGFTCLNDVTARDLQKLDGQWTRAKGFDTFCPIGPWIETELNYADVGLKAILNGEVKQESRTNDLIFGVEYLISFISKIMKLLPGDVIATGTPAGISAMQPGDVIEIWVEGIGTLRNRVVAKA